MQEPAEWDGFYAIVGSAAGALVGLQFVLMTLVAANPPPPSARFSPLRAYATSTPARLARACAIALASTSALCAPGTTKREAKMKNGTPVTPSDCA